MLIDLIKKNRSYRSFDPARTVSREELLSLIEHARLTAAAANRQFLRYRLVTEEEMNVLLPQLRWAAALPERHFPPIGHEPSAAILLCGDRAVAEDKGAFTRDVGIAAQTILLAATELGLGGCMIANFSPDALRAALQLPESIVPLLAIPLGQPDETVVLEDAAPGDSLAYYRDGDDVHHVPKRSLADIVL